MELEQNNELDTFERVVDFGEQHAITPAIPRATLLYARVGTAATQMRGFAVSQDGGRSGLRSGVDLREQLTTELKALMKPINEVALSLAKEEYPAVAAKFRMPRKGGYEGVVSRARSFVDALGEAGMKTLFTDRGLAATIDTDLTAKADELVAASEVKHNGMALQVGSTAALSTVAKQGRKALRELNGILRQVYKDDPMLLAAWDSARRVQRSPVREESPESPTQPLAAVNGGGMNGGSPVLNGAATSVVAAA